MSVCVSLIILLCKLRFLVVWAATGVLSSGHCCIRNSKNVVYRLLCISDYSKSMPGTHTVALSAHNTDGGTAYPYTFRIPNHVCYGHRYKDECQSTTKWYHDACHSRIIQMTTRAGSTRYATRKEGTRMAQPSLAPPVNNRTATPPTEPSDRAGHALHTDLAENTAPILLPIIEPTMPEARGPLGNLSHTAATIIALLITAAISTVVLFGLNLLFQYLATR